jgi:hypothetical protein
MFVFGLIVAYCARYLPPRRSGGFE